MCQIISCNKICDGVIKLSRPSSSSQTRFTASTKFYGFIVLKHNDNCDATQKRFSKPLASEFDTTLYADDTALMLSDRDLNSLKYKANNELKKVDFWLRMNKLSLNYSKTNYIIYNNQPHKICKDEFTIVMNQNPLAKRKFH